MVDIAAQLGLSKSTVSERIQELAAQGYITHEKYSNPEFTPRGYELAKKLTHKHRLIEVFLHDILKVPLHQVHEEAHKLEHAMSDDVIKRLGTFLNNPTTDSHGTPIPPL